MRKKLKKILFRKITLPPPEEIFDKKAVLFSMVILALFFDILILGATQSFLNSDKNKTKVMSLLETNIRKLVSGYPIEKMAPYISAKEKQTAAFLVGIAKKESNWGKYSPKIGRKDCYNYWGYRGQSENMTASGYTCFENPEEAVDTVSKRIDELMNDSDLNTPEKMIVWKCGWDCAGHSSESVSKWIADVGYYYRKVYQ